MKNFLNSLTFDQIVQFIFFPLLVGIILKLSIKKILNPLQRFWARTVYTPPKIFCNIFKEYCKVSEHRFEKFETILNDSDFQTALIEKPEQVDKHYHLMKNMYFEMFFDGSSAGKRSDLSIEEFCLFLQGVFINYKNELEDMAAQYDDKFDAYARHIDINFRKIKELFGKALPPPPEEPLQNWKKDWQSLYLYCRKHSEKRLKLLRERGKYVFSEKSDENYYIDRKLFPADDRCLSLDGLLFSEKDTILIGKTGGGKTNEICKFVEHQMSSDKRSCVLLYTGSDLANMRKWDEPINLKALIENLIRLNGSIDYDELVGMINSLAKVQKRNFIIVIDAVNDFSDPTKSFCNPLLLCQHIIELSAYNRKKGLERVKIVLSMREETYKLIQQTEDSEALKSSCAIFVLKDFSEEELENAYSLYAQNIPTPFKLLSGETRRLCKNPILLKLLCRTYSGKSLEGVFSKSKVFKEYYRKYVLTEGHARAGSNKDLIDFIINTMVSKHTDRLSIEDAPVSNMIDGGYSTYNKEQAFYRPYFFLKEVNILFEEDGIIKFCFEPFFEWLLTEYFRLRSYTAVQIKDLLEKSGYLASYWKAAGLHLVATQKHSVITKLITFNEPKLNIFLVDSISEAIGEYPGRTISILRKMLKFRTDKNQAELAILIIHQIFSQYSEELNSDIRNHLINLYIKGLKNSDDVVSDIANQHLAMLWDDTTTKDVGEAIIRIIANRVNLFFLSLIGLKFIINIIANQVIRFFLSPLGMKFTTKIGIRKERTITVLLDMTILIVGEYLENESKFREFLEFIQKPLTILLPLLKWNRTKKFLVNRLVKLYQDTGEQNYAGNYSEIKRMIEEDECRDFIKWLAPYFVSPGFFQKEKEILEGAKLNNGMVAWLLQAVFTVRAHEDKDIDRILHLMECMYEVSDEMISQWSAIRSLFRIYLANYYLAKYELGSTCFNKRNMERVEAEFYKYSEDFVARSKGFVHLKSSAAERQYKDTTLFYSFLIDGLYGKNRFRLFNRSMRQARDEGNLPFLENILESVGKAGSRMYWRIALDELLELIRDNLKARADREDHYTGREYELLVETLANIRGRYRKNVDNFLELIEEENRATSDVSSHVTSEFIKKIQNASMKFDMPMFRTVYGQLVYFKMAVFYPDCIHIFSEALDEAIDQLTVEDFFYCFVDRFSGWFLSMYDEWKTSP